ncbi:MAG TPA: FAD-dependent oxidoreductase [Gemmatimonadales bacterium]|nr:FAD-dependent oxidoreductase [Gemmatimonadales bacterium]
MSHPKLVEGEVRLIGNRWSPRVHALKAFFARSRVPYRWMDLERGSAAADAAEHAIPGSTRFPVVLFPDGSFLIDPDVREVATRLGLDIDPDARCYDLIVVGGGPAGLAASIYSASEGLRTLVVEQEVPGGQVTYSAIVENYPGFPEAQTGSDLARRTVEQAERFGVEILVTRRATRLATDGDSFRVTLDDTTAVAAHTVLLALGVSFRWLEVPGCSALVGAGIYYGAATAEASACRDQDIYILGGGNSAAQAALLLSQFARRVVILTLESSLEESVSHYLVERIGRVPNIIVRPSHTVVAAEGNGRLEKITIRNVKTGATEQVQADGLFVFIGATPRTEWLGNSVTRDSQGFILSGTDLLRDCRPPEGWPLAREPYGLETSTPGVFVAGDVRHGSVKRLAAAVGEGAMAVQFIHWYLSRKEAPASQETATVSR